MRYLFASLIFCLLVNAIPVRSYAQANLSINDVEKIHFVDGAGYLGGYFKNEYELLFENGQWRTYQTHESYRRFNHKSRSTDIKKRFDELDSAEHKLIKVFPADSISAFLKTLRVIKPKFNPAAFHLSIPKLTTQVDSGLKNLDQKRIKIFNSFFDTPTKLYHLLDTIQYDFWTDDYPYSVIEIIKKSHDTVKVITTRQVDYMLPWYINNTPTYDLSINRFFIGATGLSTHRMSGPNIVRSIREHVDYLYAQDAFERLRWQETSPQTYSYINKHFYIVSTNRFNDDTRCTLQSKVLSKHVLIDCMVNFSDQDKLATLTAFAQDSVKQFLKKGGFMIDSCLQKHGCTIHFGNNDGHFSHSYFSTNQKRLDAILAKYNHDQLKAFDIRYGQRTEDNWIALPDGKFLLTAYIDKYAVGIPSKYIDQTRTGRRWFVFMLFDRDGKLLEQSE